MSFNPSVGGQYPYVFSTVVQSDGKFVLGGRFSTINGVTRNSIARLNADGSLDASFVTDAGAGTYVGSVTLQNDGKILIGGGFTTINGTPRANIARLNADGTLDTAFAARAEGDPNGVGKIILQNDGKIMIFGSFTSVNGVGRNQIARLNTDGSLDTSFDLGSGADSLIYTQAVQGDGKVVIGGHFTSVNGVAHNRLARLNPNGSLDNSFNLNADNDLVGLALRSNGKIVASGFFTKINGVARPYISQFNAVGTLDTSFNPGSTPSTYVGDIAIQNDGKIVFATRSDNVARSQIARLNADGSLDASFETGAYANENVFFQLQGDGKILVFGYFSVMNGAARTGIARLNGDPRGTLQFDAASYNAAESLGSVTLQVTRKNGSAGAISVNYATANGEAKSGSDYTATSGTLSWADGDGSAKSFAVPIINDTVVEGSESFVVSLSAPTSGAALGSPVQSVVTILDDDTSGGSPGVLQFEEPAYSLAENAGAATITVRRAGGSTGAVGVGYATSNGTATAGDDYQSVSGTLSWADGNSDPKTFTVPITDDTAYEGNETVNLALRSATGGTSLGSPSQAVLTIIDNDPVPSSPAGVIAFSQSGYSVVENAGSAAITVTRTGGSTGAVSVGYATTAGSAVAGTRYENASGTLSWADGDAGPKNFVVPILNDTVADGEQTVLLALNAPAGGATLGSAGQAVLTIKDDGDTAPPQPSGDLIQAVNLISPPTDIKVLAGQTLDLYVSVEAVSAGKFQKVEFFAGDTSLGFSTALRDRKTWMPATPGDYLLKAVATDINGAQKISANPIHVLLPQKNTTAPSATLLSGLNGRKFAAGSSVELVASATDAKGQAVKVQFYADGQPLATTSIGKSAADPTGRRTNAFDDDSNVGRTSATSSLTGSYYGAALRLGNQLRDVLLTAASTNKDGITTVSKGVTIKAATARDTISCAITSPSGDGTIMAGTKATVSAGKGSGAVSKVEFFINQTSIGSLTKAPFEFTMPAQSTGRYALTAIATDSTGVSKISEPVVVNFVNLPTVSLSAASASAVPGGKNGVLLFKRTGGDLSKALTVKYKTKGAAKPGVDFQALSGIETIPAKAAQDDLQVQALGDLGGAAQKKLKVVLQPGEGYKLDPANKPVKIKLLAN